MEQRACSYAMARWMESAFRLACRDANENSKALAICRLAVVLLSASVNKLYLSRPSDV